MSSGSSSTFVHLDRCLTTQHDKVKVVRGLVWFVGQRYDPSEGGTRESCGARHCTASTQELLPLQEAADAHRGDGQKRPRKCPS